MALGIGATTAVFSVVHAVLLRPLPYPAAERLVMVWEQRHAVRRNTVGGHEYPVWKAGSRTLEMAAIAYDRDFTLTGAGDPALLSGVRVTSDFFKVLAVAPAAGRVFGPEADVPGHGDVAVISHRLWTERFGQQPSIVGRTIELNDRPYIVSGVMPPDFQFPANAAGVAPALWTPIAEPIQQYRGRHFLFVVGRLKADATPAQAQAELAAIAAGIAREFPVNRAHGVNVQPLQSELVDGVRDAILVLFTAVGVVLLVACCNIANLLLARATARQQEIAVRAALGAGRMRIARQLLAEGALLSAAGAGAGLVVAWWLVAFARTAVPSAVPRLATAAIDPAAVAFTIAVALATTFVFGLVPLWQLSRVQVADRLRSGNKGVPSSGRHPLRSALVIAEVALTLALSIAAALLVQSILRLQRVETGFDSGGVTTVGLTLPAARYPTAAHQRTFYQDAVERLAKIPGIERVAATNMVPHGGGLSGIPIVVQGRPAPRPGEELMARYRIVSTEYFRTLGIPTLRGRTFVAADARAAVPLIRWFPQQPLPPRFNEPQAPPAAVINSAMARSIWPGEDAVGRTFTVLFSPPVTVVGVVGDARNATLGDQAVPEFYLSDLQEPQARMTLLARASDHAATLPAIRTELAQLDPKLPLAAVRTLDEVVGANLSLHRFISTMMGAFAAAALLLLIAGVYSVVSFATAQRTHEIGVRLALGATRIDVAGLIARSGALLCAAGLVLGLAGGYALARSAANLLYGIEPTDARTYSALVIVVVAAAAAACWLPARRALRVDPASVLRAE
jgi:putative ABC transport system permease protein